MTTEPPAAEPTDTLAAENERLGTRVGDTVAALAAAHVRIGALETQLALCSRRTLRDRLTDWRFPAAVAAVLLSASVVLSQAYSIPAGRRLNGTLAARSQQAACIAQITGRYEAETIDVLTLFLGTDRATPEQLDAHRRALADLATDLDRIAVLCPPQQ